jgi:hypothetical protein
MADDAIVQLLRRAPFGFVGTVDHLGAATMKGVPIDDHTAVVLVDYVLHAPQAFTALQGQRITVQLAPDKPLLTEGETAAFFAQSLAIGDTIAVAEIDRRPVTDVEQHLGDAAAFGADVAQSNLKQDVEIAEGRDHFATADAAVVGRVLRLESTQRATFSEHDPDWWVAIIDVYQVEKGDVALGELPILYCNSIDVRWRNAPKPRASQEGVWVLHATEPPLRDFARFSLLHPNDYQPVDRLDALRATRG